MNTKRLLRVAALAVLSASAMTIAQPIPAFSGADGAARTVSGGRGGVVYRVTKLDKNYSDTGPGTLRYGLTDSNFPAGTRRTIVFDVAGTFWLGRYGAERGHDNGWDTQSRLGWGSNVTVAGQTAPGPVYIMGGVTKASGVNSIIRNVTIAPGYGMRNFSKPEDGIFPTPGDFPDSYVFDAIDITGQNIMIDHVSTLYATDETISANELAANITIQYSNISQGQNYPQADAEASGVTYTGHALGSLFQMGSNASLSVHHNLYAHQKGRLPRVGSEVGTGAYNDFRNNVFYNWLGTAGGGASGQPSYNNFEGNFYLAGPGGDNPVGGSSTAITTAAGGTGIFSGSNSTGTRIYHAGNLRDANKDGDANDGVALTNSNFGSASFQAAPLWSGGVRNYLGVTDSATAALDRVLRYMGPQWWLRDGVVDTPDERLIHEVRTGTGKIMAWADDPFNSDPNEGVEWRQMLSYRADPVTGVAPFSRPTGWDSDGDGMPDFWESKHGLDPLTHNPNGDFDADGYTDLEEYINDIAAWPAPTAIVFNAASSNRYANILNWDSNPDPNLTAPWQPSRFDTAQVNAGTALVDAIAQDAFVVQIGAATGNAATLRVDAGWLHVRNGVDVGAAVGSTNAALVLAGGKLVVEGQIAGGLGAGARFELTGGTLIASRVDMTRLGGTLQNGGAVIAPGDVGVAGRTELIGSLASSDTSEIAIELGGTAAASVFQHTAGRHDRIDVSGTASLDGTLKLALIGGYTPQALASHVVISAASVVGRFDAIEGVQASADRWLAVTYDATTVRVISAVPGDANLNGTVDFADLLVLAQAYDAEATWVSGDFTGNGLAGFEDLLVLAQRYGAADAFAADWAMARSVVPEPATAVVGMFAMGLMARRVR